MWITSGWPVIGPELQLSDRQGYKTAGVESNHSHPPFSSCPLADLTTRSELVLWSRSVSASSPIQSLEDRLADILYALSTIKRSLRNRNPNVRRPGSFHTKNNCGEEGIIRLLPWQSPRERK